jgi:hypothetical protein
VPYYRDDPQNEEKCLCPEDSRVYPRYHPQNVEDSRVYYMYHPRNEGKYLCPEDFRVYLRYPPRNEGKYSRYHPQNEGKYSRCFLRLIDLYNVIVKWKSGCQIPLA